MTDRLASFALLAAQGARGDPSGTSGIVIIAAIVVAVLIIGLAMAFFFTRSRARRTAMTRTPAREGRVGRISEFNDS